MAFEPLSRHFKPLRPLWNRTHSPGTEVPSATNTTAVTESFSPTVQPKWQARSPEESQANVLLNTWNWLKIKVIFCQLQTAFQTSFNATRDSFPAFIYLAINHIWRCRRLTDDGGQQSDHADGDHEAGPAVPVLSGRDEGKQHLPEDGEEVHDVVVAGRESPLATLVVVVAVA